MRINCHIRSLVCVSLLINFILLSCNQQPSVRTKEFLAIFNKLGKPQHLNSTYFYLLIPVDGCGPCARESVSFAKENKNNKTFRAVLISRNGKKDILLAYGETPPERYIIDPKGLFFEKGFTNGTVHLIKIIDGIIVSEEDYSPRDVSKKLGALYDALKNVK